jgi:3-oxoacyl-(acyl-carrier-protein) synthase
MQIAYAAMMLKNGKLLPTLGFEEPMDGVKLNIQKEILDFKNVKYALVNANAFGGKCGACILGKL